MEKTVVFNAWGAVLHLWQDVHHGAYDTGNVSEEEKHDEANDDAEVAPQVRAEVLKGRVDVVIAVHHVRARNGTDGRADTVERADRFVAREIGAGHECVACVILVVELVDHEGLETVGERVDVVDPTAPPQHVVNRDDEAGKDDQGEDDKGCGHHSLR